LWFVGVEQLGEQELQLFPFRAQMPPNPNRNEQPPTRRRQEARSDPEGGRAAFMHNRLAA
jgi:hypothetical protein